MFYVHYYEFNGGTLGIVHKNLFRKDRLKKNLVLIVIIENKNEGT